MESIVFWGFNLHAWITIATVLTMFTILLFTKLRADLVFMGAVGILFVTGVLDVKEAFSGFSSGSVVVIGVLSIIAMRRLLPDRKAPEASDEDTAAGAMSFPIMYEAAEKLGYEPYPFLIALMISVSSSFATPIGSPTHMLVYGPGGYRFSDFMRVGLLMNLIILAANIFIVNIVYPLTPLQ